MAFGNELILGYLARDWGKLGIKVAGPLDASRELAIRPSGKLGTTCSLDADREKIEGHYKEKGGARQFPCWLKPAVPLAEHHHEEPRK